MGSFKSNILNSDYRNCKLQDLSDIEKNQSFNQITTEETPSHVPMLDNKSINNLNSVSTYQYIEQYICLIPINKYSIYSNL